jgi:mannose-6-phosphate isomerase-like protein (cupin superfamily)
MQELASTFVVIGPDQSAATVSVTPTVFEELDKRFDHFRGRLLVASFRFDADWPTWEIHPHGDEIVVLMSGAADMILDEKAGHRVVKLAKPGEFVIVPKNTWHTARVSAPTVMLFVTPGEGTQNQVRP